MKLVDIFQALGEEGFQEAMKTVTVSKLKTYQLYESLKTRAGLPKLNVKGMKKAVPRFWERLATGDEELAEDLAQAVLVSNLDLIVAVLDHLEVPHQDGFFDKDFDASEILTGDWQQKAFDHFKADFPHALLVFYLNHLAMETTGAEELFTPAGDK